MNTIYFTPISLSQLLKEKGVKQVSEYYHQKITQDEWKLTHVSEFNGINKAGQIEVSGAEQLRSYAEDGDDAYSAFTLSELPDVFRQVFGEENIYKIQQEWRMFCMQYLRDPKTAWETLEKTIKEL